MYIQRMLCTATHTCRRLHLEASANSCCISRETAEEFKISWGQDSFFIVPYRHACSPNCIISFAAYFNCATAASTAGAPARAVSRARRPTMIRASPSGAPGTMDDNVINEEEHECKRARTHAEREIQPTSLKGRPVLQCFYPQRGCLQRL